MAEAHDARELVEAQAAAERDPDFFPLNDLPNDLIVSVFAAAEDLIWVRHTFPLVCKAWNELYCSKNASPLYETLEINFGREIREIMRAWLAAAALRAAAAQAAGAEASAAFVDLPVVHASRIISWAQARAGSVLKLDLKWQVHSGTLKGFSRKDLGALVAAVGPSLTDISICRDLGRLCTRPFWKSLRTSVVPARRLRSFSVEGIGAVFNESDIELLGQLAGSLEEMKLETPNFGRPPEGFEVGLPRFPESFCALTELRRLVLAGHPQITAIPASISSLKKLKYFSVRWCNLSSLPKELRELSRLTRLDLTGNRLPVRSSLGATLPAAEAFPAELGKMKSLRVLELGYCGLRTVPPFVCGLESLEILTLLKNELSSLPKELGELSGLTKLDLSRNESLGNTLPAAEAFPAELGNMKSLRELELSHCRLRTVPSFVGGLKSLESLDLSGNGLSSLAKELGELSGLTKLDLSCNQNLGTTLPAAEAFPTELGNMKSLRDLSLSKCGLRTVPSFVCGLESLEILFLHSNDLSSLPKELIELSGLTKLELAINTTLGNTLPAAEAFPAELGKMKSLRELGLSKCGLRTVPSFLGELKSLQSLTLCSNNLSSLAKELGELSGLTKLDLSRNQNLGTMLLADQALSAQLGKMKSLRRLVIRNCGLRTVPAFVGELESLESLDLYSDGVLQIDAPLDFLIDGCPRLRCVDFFYGRGRTPEARAHLEAFKAKLLARNPYAVFYG